MNKDALITVNGSGFMDRETLTCYFEKEVIPNLNPECKKVCMIPYLTERFLIGVVAVPQGKPNDSIHSPCAAHSSGLKKMGWVFLN